MSPRTRTISVLAAALSALLAIGSCVAGGDSRVTAPPLPALPEPPTSITLPSVATSSGFALEEVPGAKPLVVATAIGRLEFVEVAFPARMAPMAPTLWEGTLGSTAHGPVAVLDVQGTGPSLGWSTDFVTWTAATIDPPERAPERPLLAGGEAILTGGMRYRWGSSGWVPVAATDTISFIVAAFGPAGVVARTPADYYFATDGIHFTQATADPGPARDGCDHGSDYLFATADGFIALTSTPGQAECSPTQSPMVWRSSDGLTWTLDSISSPFGDDATLLSVAASDSGVVAAGFTGAGPDKGVVWTSKDGRRWKRHAIPGALVPDRVFVGGMGWILTASADHPVFWVSADGTTFQGPYPLPAPLRESGFENIQMVVGNDGALAIAPPVGDDPATAKRATFLIRRLS
jgi:hypothetical protein